MRSDEVFHSSFTLIWTRARCGRQGGFWQLREGFRENGGDRHPPLLNAGKLAGAPAVLLRSK